MFIALRWMQDREGVMMWRAENIQACLRIFRRTQHQWLARDILHPSQGVYSVFVLHPLHDPQDRIRLIRGKKSSGVLPSRQMLLTGLYPRVLPPVTYGSALQAPECLWDTIRGRTETSRGWEGLSLFIALRWMQRPERVMMWLTENV